MTEAAVLGVLRGIQDPDSHQDIVSLGLVKEIAIQGGQVSFTLEFTNQAPLSKAEIHSKARKAVAQLPGVSDAKVKMGAATRPAPEAPREDLIPDVKTTIAVSSGKGGVGKSTVAVNLA
ncbi:MAG: iron-sulfur cluster assembly protein, partial [Actinomycetota bacterium]